MAAALVACSLASVSVPASGAAARAREGTLSPRLAELAKPSVRALPPARQARLLSLARQGPASLLRRGNRVVVEARFEDGAAAAVTALRAAGAQVVDVSRRYETVTVAAKPADLHAIARVAGVAGVSEVLAPLVFAGTGCPSGATVSEGDGQLRAAEARSGFDVDGSGVTVGILSDSFDQATEAADGSGPVATHAAEDVATGDLPGTGNPCGDPTPVNVLENDFEPGPADEGRGMAQIVHDLAPGANLAFASAFNGSFSFAGNIERLARPVAEGGAGAQVIADDVAYFEEPFFQDGPIAVAANRVTAAGADYFSAAGNDNLIEAGTKNDIASWEAPEFRDSPPSPSSCPAPLVAKVGAANAADCMDFNPAAAEADNMFGITVEEGETLTVDLQWAEPWFGVETDLDAFLLDSAGKPIEVEFEGEKFLVGSASDNAGKTQMPVEVFSWENTGPTQEVELAINRCALACNPAASALAAPPLLKFALLENGGGVSETEYPESEGGDTVGPTIFGHAGSAGAIGVGAVRFNTTSEPEEYSSRGPVTHYFGPVATASPAAKLPSPETLSKPDVAATDCGVTTFFAFEVGGAWRFCGTSAAAPHAAAVAALMRQANPGLSPSQLRAGLASTARPVGSFGADAVGGGLVDAFHAVAATALPPAIAIGERPPALSRNRSPSIGFSANRPVSFACSLDGGALEPCASPFTPALPLADGEHGFVVTGVDVAGLLGRSETVTFKVDTRRPNTFFRRHPRRLIRTRHRKARAAFRFGSNEEGVTFTCRVDGGLPRFCRERLRRRFRVGAHSVRVAATDAAGNTDRTPAVFHFKVKHAS